MPTRRLVLPLAVVVGLAFLALLAVLGGLAPIWSRAAPPPARAVSGDAWARPADGMTMLFVPGGTFRMGSFDPDVAFAYDICTKYNLACHTCKPGPDICQREWFNDEQPAHRVTLDGFWLDRTEVTNAQYARCLKAGACTLPSETGFYVRQNYYSDPEYASYPVLYVNWSQAAGYCKWTGGRLPTEAEWEYADAGPANMAFPWGNDFDGSRLNFCDKNCWLPGGATEWDDGFEETAPAGSYPSGASWAGVLDLAGNAAEWVSDWYAPDYYSHSPERNPQGPADGERRVQRGGSWGLQPLYAYSHYRAAKPPNDSDIYAGFRCAHSASTPQAGTPSGAYR